MGKVYLQPVGSACCPPLPRQLTQHKLGPFYKQDIAARVGNAHAGIISP